MRRGITIFIASSLMACAAYHLPEGDPAAGREAFMDLQCYTCHRVTGEDFPEPKADPPVPVVLGSAADPKSRQYLAESIIAPSHRFAKPKPEMIATEPPLYTQEQYKDIRSGDLSRMGDFSKAMTVRQWIDLVAFLEAKQQPD